MNRRTWFIETNVASSTDSKQLEIDSTERVDFLFVLIAEILDLILFDCAVWDVDVLFSDVDVVEEAFSHEVVVALFVVLRLFREIVS